MYQFQASRPAALRLLLVWPLALSIGGEIRAAESVRSSAAGDEQQAGDELVQMVVRLLADEDRQMRALGLEQVRTAAKGAAATRLFAAQLPRLKADAQVELLRALAARGDPAAVAAVREVLAPSRDEPVRLAAIDALGGLGDASDVPRLVQVLAADSQPEVAAARRCLVSLRGDAVDAALQTAMKDATAPQRDAVVGVVAARKALDTMPLDEALSFVREPLKWIPAAGAEAPRSQEGPGTMVVFINQSDRPVKVVWVGYNGQLRRYAELAPGASHRQNTSAGNTWLITSDDNKPLGHFIAEQQPSRAVVPK